MEQYVKPTMDVIAIPEDIIMKSCTGVHCAGVDVIELPELP